MPYCPRCGARVEEGDAYCWHCGFSLDVIYLVRKQPIQPPSSLAGAIKEAFVSIFKPSPYILHPSIAVYERLPPYTPIRKYLYVGVALTIIGLTLVTFGAWIWLLGFTIAAFTSPILMFIWMYRNDRYEREPLPLIALTFGWGVIAAFLALLVNTTIITNIKWWIAPMAALTEEPLKAIGVYWLARHRNLGKEFNDHLDGMVYGAASGVGFAGAENVIYIIHFAPIVGAPLIIFVRSISPITHMVCTGLVGRSLGLAKVRKGYVQPADIIPGMLVAMVFHALWNAISIFSLLLLFPAYVAVFAKLIREARRDEVLWGYAKGYAPSER